MHTLSQYQYPQFSTSCSQLGCLDAVVDHRHRPTTCNVGGSICMKSLSKTVALQSLMAPKTIPCRARIATLQEIVVFESSFGRHGTDLCEGKCGVEMIKISRTSGIRCACWQSTCKETRRLGYLAEVVCLGICQVGLIPYFTRSPDELK